MVSHICFKKVVLLWASMCHLMWPLTCFYCHDLHECDSMLACPYSLERGEFKPITNSMKKKGLIFSGIISSHAACWLGKEIMSVSTVSDNSCSQLQQLHQRKDDNFLKRLTGDVGLSCEDCVLEFIRHHCEFIVWCPVDSDGVVRCRAQLLPYGRSVGSCGGWKEIWIFNHFKTTPSIILTNSCPN